jgi:hypothetical protein
MKKLYAALAAALALTTAACGPQFSDAQIASQNLSTAADNFEIVRRVVFYNGITGAYILSLEGRCSLGSGSQTNSLTVTCKDGPNSYKKHFLGLSHNVTFFAEQMQAANASTYHYRVVFKPQAILPDIDFRGSAKELVGG